MKNLFLSLILTVISFSVFAQDTIYMDNNYQELDKKENAKYFKIVTPTPGKDYEFLRTTYFVDGTKKAEQSYDLKDEKKIYEGLHKHYYESGELFHSIEFKKGKMHGELIAYWKNGIKRRHDYFKRNKLKKGTVWNKAGEEIEYFPFEIPPEFPGGQKALQKYLIENIKIPTYHNSMQRVVIRFTINCEGNTTDIKIVEEAPAEYMVEAYRVVKEMPKWKPGKQFGEVVNVSYSLPLVFQK
tara:strand:+ start:736 stop:1458 length:723 start_codon:yes stop_codon:yes gene_type:complete